MEPDGVSDKEIEELQEKIQNQRGKVRESLADNLCGEPEDYNAEKHFAGRQDEAIADGGDK